MRVTVYGIDIPLEDKDYENMGEIIDLIEDRGYVITKVIADKRELTPLSEEAIEKAKPIEHLEVIARKVEDLVMEGVVEARNYLPRLIAGIDDIIDKFTQGQEAEGYKLLNQALEGLQWLNTLLNNLRYNLKLEELGDFGLKSFIDDWKDKLEELLGAMRNQDIVLLSDILEYEILPLLKDYSSILNKLNH